MGRGTIGRKMIRQLGRISFARRAYSVPALLKSALKDVEALERNARERNVNIDTARLSELYDKRRDLVHGINQLNTQRRSNTDATIGRRLRQEINALQVELTACEAQLEEASSQLPNWSAPEAPLAEEGNRVVYCSPIEETRSLDHCDWNERRKLIDFERAAIVSGAHFFALKGTLALLEQALVSFSLSKAIKRGFQPISVPDAVKDQFIYASGFQPRQRAGDGPVFRIAGGDGLALAGTSEIYLAGQFKDAILTDLPVKMVGVSHCFRSEVGHHSALSRGLYRVHQFTKVELFSVVAPEESNEAFREITSLQADILSDLQLPFRQLEMHRGELGASAARKWDHEVWMPGRAVWGEVMSTSNCTDYQSRRLNIRYRRDGELLHPHTLNGTACAVPRIMMALIENGAEEDTLKLPSCLRPFMPALLDDLSITWK